MDWHPEDERRWVVARVRAGEPITGVAAALGRSRQWLYTWLTRAATGGERLGAGSLAPRHPSAPGHPGRGRSGRAAGAAGTVQPGPAVWGAEYLLALGGAGPHPTPLGSYHQPHSGAPRVDPPTDGPLKRSLLSTRNDCQVFRLLSADRQLSRIESAIDIGNDRTDSSECRISNTQRVPEIRMMN